MTSRTTRSPLLDALLQLAEPIEPRPDLRILEIGTDPDAGASAAELAERYGGSVVSLSRSSHDVAKARAAHPDDPRLAFRRQLPLTAGWTPDGPYHLVLSWEIPNTLPRAWLRQCAPGGQIVSAIPMYPPAPTMIGVVHLTTDHEQAPQSPNVAMIRAVDGITESVEWDIRPALLDANENGYIVSLAGSSW